MKSSRNPAKTSGNPPIRRGIDIRTEDPLHYPDHMARVFGSTKRQFGDRGEKLAEKFLRRLGYRIVARNVTTGRVGEIDLVAVHQGTLVFVEVKTRRSNRFGSPEEAVSTAKLEKLSHAIQWYLQQKGLERARYRLDVIAIDCFREVPVIRHHMHVGH